MSYAVCDVCVHGVVTGVPQGSKLSPTLFSFYIADIPRPTEPVKQICHADDITVWPSVAEISELEHKVKHLFDGEVPIPTGKLAFDISTKVISDLVYARPGAGQYPPEDQDR